MILYVKSLLFILYYYYYYLLFIAWPSSFLKEYCTLTGMYIGGGFGPDISWIIVSCSVSILGGIRKYLKLLFRLRSYLIDSVSFFYLRHNWVATRSQFVSFAFNCCVVLLNDNRQYYLLDCVDLVVLVWYPLVCMRCQYRRDVYILRLKVREPKYRLYCL